MKKNRKCLWRRLLFQRSLIRKWQKRHKVSQTKRQDIKRLPENLTEQWARQYTGSSWAMTTNHDACFRQFFSSILLIPWFRSQPNYVTQKEIFFYFDGDWMSECKERHLNQEGRVLKSLCQTLQ
jgi:hypothetical protein